jgi:hypothetical protein
LQSARPSTWRLPSRLGRCAISRRSSTSKRSLLTLLHSCATHHHSSSLANKSLPDSYQTPIRLTAAVAHIGIHRGGRLQVLARDRYERTKEAPLLIFTTLKSKVQFDLFVKTRSGNTLDVVSVSILIRCIGTETDA